MLSFRNFFQIMVIKLKIQEMHFRMSITGRTHRTRKFWTHLYC